ncbi:MAG: ATP-binding cassette domain-containing protein [Thermotogota bacterium]
MFLLGITTFFVIWHIISLFYTNLILPGPLITIETLFYLLGDSVFWSQFLNTFLKSITGLVISLGIGVPLGFLAGLNSKFDNFIRPTVMFFQGAPIVSYIAISMLWFGIGFYTPVFVAFVVIFPTIVFNISNGIRSTDKNLIEMAKLYKIPNNIIRKYIYLPSIIPFIVSTLKIISGTLWRAIVVGEFLAGAYGIGYSLSLSKATLKTEEVFAYTIFLIIVGIIFEKSLLKINFNPKIRIKKNISTVKYHKSENIKDIKIENISFSYKETKVIQNLNMKIEKNKTTALIGESGSGKTTILYLLSKLRKDYKGKIKNVPKKISFVYQDDRLIPWLNINDNIKIVNPNLENQDIEEFLSMMNIQEKQFVYPDKLSGGMKKRVNIARALAYNPELLLLDEPFSSLDLKTKYNLIEDLKEIFNKKNITTLIVSHDPHEISEVSDKLYLLSTKERNIIWSYDLKDNENSNVVNLIKEKIIYGG